MSEYKKLEQASEKAAISPFCSIKTFEGFLKWDSIYGNDCLDMSKLVVGEVPEANIICGVVQPKKKHFGGIRHFMPVLEYDGKKLLTDPFLGLTEPFDLTEFLSSNVDKVNLNSILDAELSIRKGDNGGFVFDKGVGRRSISYEADPFYDFKDKYKTDIGDVFPTMIAFRVYNPETNKFIEASLINKEAFVDERYLRFLDDPTMKDTETLDYRKGELINLLTNGKSSDFGAFVEHLNELNAAYYGIKSLLKSACDITNSGLISHHNDRSSYLKVEKKDD